MAARWLVSNPCEDGCGELRTDRTCDGAPVYRCPACDSEWIEEHEVAGTEASRPQRGSLVSASRPWTG